MKQLKVLFPFLMAFVVFVSSLLLFFRPRDGTLTAFAAPSSSMVQYQQYSFSNPQAVGNLNVTTADLGRTLLAVDVVNITAGNNYRFKIDNFEATLGGNPSTDFTLFYGHSAGTDRNSFAGSFVEQGSVNGTRISTFSLYYTAATSVFSFYVDRTSFSGAGATLKLSFTFSIEMILATPVPRLNGNVLSWNAVPNAGRYAIYKSGSNTPIATVSETSYTLTSYGDYAVQAVSVSSGSQYHNSAISNYISYSSPQSVKLGTPMNVTINGSFLTWDNVDNARVYYVFNNVTAIGFETTVNSAYLADSGIYRVRALGYDNYTSSDWSSAITYNAVVPAPSDNPTAPLFQTVGAFLDMEIFPSFKLYYFFLIGFGSTLLMFFIKMFLGG